MAETTALARRVGESLASRHALPVYYYGAVLVGVRDILVAFNVWLASGEVAVAREIARVVRESSGGLPALGSR